MIHVQITEWKGRPRIPIPINKTENVYVPTQYSSQKGSALKKKYIKNIDSTVS